MVKESLRNRIRFRFRISVMIKNRVSNFLSVIFSSESRLWLRLGLCYKVSYCQGYVYKEAKFNGRIIILMRKIVMSIIIVRFSCRSLIELGDKVE